MVQGLAGHPEQVLRNKSLFPSLLFPSSSFSFMRFIGNLYQEGTTPNPLLPELQCLILLKLYSKTTKEREKLIYLLKVFYLKPRNNISFLLRKRDFTTISTFNICLIFAYHLPKPCISLQA